MTNPGQTRVFHALAPNQREIWFDQMLDPDRPGYNIGGYLELGFAVDVDRLRRAFAILVDRHDALRIRLHTDARGIPVQTFEDRVDFDMPLHDFSGATAPEEEARTWMQAAMERPFDLASFPLFEVAILKLAADRHLSFYKLHHLIVDGMGFAQMSQEQADIYGELAGGGAGPSRAVSYRVFLERQQRYRESPRYQADRDYWEKLYRTAPEPVFPPLHAHRFEEDVAPCGRTTLTLERSFYDRLEALVPDATVTSFHVILAALYVYFTRCYDRDDLAVGLPVLNRPGAALKSLVGLCVGVSPAWFRCGRDLAFSALVRSIAGELKQVYRRQRFPVSEVNHLAGLDGITRRQLFDLALSFERHDYRTSVGTQPVEIGVLTNNRLPEPLNVFIREFHPGDDVQVDLVHNLAYLDASEAERLAARLEQLLRAAADAPDAPTRDLPLLTDHDHRSLAAWNRTEEEITGNRTVVDRFDTAARAGPDRIALEDEKGSLSYRELGERSDRLAGRLREMGVGTGSLVGLFMPRSVDAFAAILAILKAGGVHLPLDPGYPAERIRFMLADSRAEVVLTLASLRDGLADFEGRVVCLETEADRDAGAPGRPDPQELAYVIYTSGSTGTPKAVMVEHRGLANLIASQIRIFDVQPGSRVLQFAPLNFDASLSEMFMALGCGATLCIAPADRLLPDASLIGFLEGERITHATLPPSVLAVLPDAVLPDLHVLLSAGEACSAAVVRRWAPGRRFFNGYGPTEVSIGASIGECDAEGGKPSIGPPLPNTRIFILDRAGEPLPPGVPGEICVAGVGVARGYLHRPDLTDRQFVEIEDVGRVYKTGDLGRWLSDGSVEHLGRVDQQVKVRGFRIEPGEIEAALRGHPEVDDAVVAAVGEAPHEKLVAYVVAPAGVGRDQLRPFLSQQLPDYMIPSAFVTLETVPLSPSGKVDRRALPRPGTERDGAYVPPRDDLDRQLQTVWQRVMDLDQIGITDNFFAIGGTSLQAAALVNDLERELGVDVPLGALFKHPTIEDLAAYLRTRPTGAKTPWPLLLPVQTLGGRTPFFCLPGANGSGFYLHALSRALGSEQPFYALQIPGLDGSPVPDSVEELARIHLALIKETQAQGPYRLGGHSSGGALAFEIARLLEAGGDEVALLAVFDTTVAQGDEANPYAGFTTQDWVRELLTLFGEDPDQGPELAVDENGALIPSDETFGYVRDFLARHEMLAANARLDQVAALLNVFKTVSLAHATYRPAGMISAPVKLFIADILPLRGVRLDERESGWGWQVHTSAGIEVIRVPGNHLNMLNDPHVASAAAELRRCLDPSAARATAGPGRSRKES